MAADFKILCAANIAKAIKSSDWPTTLGSDGAFEDSAAQYISNGTILNTGNNRDIIIIDGNNTISLEFTPDDNLAFEQGLRIPVGFSKVEVTSVSNKVKILRYNYQVMNTTISDAFNSSNASNASVSDKLYPGDIIVADGDSTCTFTIELELDSSLRYSKTGFDVINLSNAN
jgi:hypothetical protein